MCVLQSVYQHSKWTLGYNIKDLIKMQIIQLLSFRSQTHTLLPWLHPDGWHHLNLITPDLLTHREVRWSCSYIHTHMHACVIIIYWDPQVTHTHTITHLHLCTCPWGNQCTFYKSFVWDNNVPAEALIGSESTVESHDISNSESNQVSASALIKFN